MKIGNQPLVTWAGDEIRDIRPAETAAGAGSTMHHVRGGDMLDALAFEYYGNEALWYMIADANAIMDVLSELTPGSQLLIPRL